MKLKKLVFGGIILFSLNIFPIQKKSLSNFKFIGGSVLPIITLPKSKQKYILLGREGAGNDYGTFDAFGGARDPGEKHPIITSAREFSEETMYKLFPSDQVSRKYININSGNTINIIANERKKFVIYLTNFSAKKIRNFAKNFYKNRFKIEKKGGPWKLIEKDKIVLIQWNKFKNRVSNAKRGRNGKLITPIMIQANIVQPNGFIKKGKIKLRPVFVSTIQSYCKKSNNYTIGKNPKIRFYSH